MISRDERRWILLFGLGLLLVTTLPYLIGYQRQGGDWRFSGFVFGVEDGNSYIAKMLRGAEGDWLFRSPYSAYPQQGILAFLPYLLLGKLTAPPGQHDQLVALYQIFRWAGGFAMLYASYAWMAAFISEVRLRRLGTILAIAGGGLGWLVIFGFNGLWGNRLPLEFYSPESFGFLSFFGLPHLALARALLLWGLLFYLRIFDSGDRRLAIGLGILWLVMGLVQPLSVLTGWIVIGVHFVISLLRSFASRSSILPLQKLFMNLCIAAGISAPLLVYTFFTSLTDAYVREWTRQNIILSPPPQDYLLAFGMLMPLLLVGLMKLRGQMQSKHLLLVGWIVVFPILAYAPHTIQRRLPEGVWAALVVLAVIGYAALRPILRRWAAGWLALSFLPAVLLIVGAIFTVWTPMPILYHPSKEIQAFEYLAQAAAPNDVVLASFNTSNELPAWAAVRTITGHGPESIHAKELQPRIERFFQPQTSEAERLTLINDFHIHYLITVPEDQLPASWMPFLPDQARVIYQNGNVRIFEMLGGQ